LLEGGKAAGGGFLYHDRSAYNVVTDCYFNALVPGEVTGGAGALLTCGPESSSSANSVQNSSDMLVDGNMFVYGPSTTKVGTFECARTTIRNNIVTADRTGGPIGFSFLWQHVCTTPPKRPRVYNNSIRFPNADSVNSAYGFTTGAAGAGQSRFTPVGTHFANNIVNIPVASGAASYRKYETAGIITESNNSTNTQVRDIDDTDVWVNASGTWLLPSDYELAPGSYAIGAGTMNVPVYNDIFGTVRSGTMDMGAVVA
jgi:hypothetical protein